MDKALPPTSAANANKRALLATALQGLLRGREAGCEVGKGFRSQYDLARGDIVLISLDRLVFFMRPAKNMRHVKGKTVPIVIGAGGKYIDAHAEVCRMLELDPTPRGLDTETPMFRDLSKPGAPAFDTNDIRDLVRLCMAAVGERATEFGAHSLRIGGATALFAAGADPIHIKTMGRWSSDCWRLYVRACFEQTLSWTVRCGSQQVHDVHGKYEAAAQEVEEY